MNATNVVMTNNKENNRTDLLQPDYKSRSLERVGFYTFFINSLSLILTQQPITHQAIYGPIQQTASNDSSKTSSKDGRNASHTKPSTFLRYPHHRFLVNVHFLSFIRDLDCHPRYY
jgi:hypothetical protein